MFPVKKALALINLYPFDTFVAGIDGYGFVTNNGAFMRGLLTDDVELFYFKRWSDEA